MCIIQASVFCGVFFVGSMAIQRTGLRPKSANHSEIVWEVGPAVGSTGELSCFNGINRFNASIETREEAQDACFLDQKCNFIWSHKCSGRWWKCYGEAPKVPSGDRSSCTHIKLEMRSVETDDPTPLSHRVDVRENKLPDGKQSALLSTAGRTIDKMNIIVNAAHPESRDGHGMHPSSGNYIGVNVTYVHRAKLENLPTATPVAEVSSVGASPPDAELQSMPDLTRRETSSSAPASQQEMAAGAGSSIAQQSDLHRESAVRSTIGIAWEWGPTVGSNGKLHCFRGRNSFDKSMESQEEAQDACSWDQKCKFIWSHKCSGRWWKCYGEAPMVQSGDRSSCTHIKIAERPDPSLVIEHLQHIKTAERHDPSLVIDVVVRK